MNETLNSTPSLRFKIVLLGESGVGKTSIVLRFTANRFHETMSPTIGASFLNESIQVEETEINLQIWDTAGQERYNSLTPLYYRGSHGALIVYDISDEQSFDRATYWVNQLQNQGGEKSKIMLIGNKFDLNQKNVDSKMASEYADQNGLLFRETSAKTGLGIPDVFVDLCKELKREVYPNSVVEKETKFKIEKNKEEEKSNCC
ncbi:ras-related protein rab-5c [Anaeramoeba flamelloides]|uniref:Ras-related protein rab-5c n=1 Tax=Anaeramoeba flamelloides TaxID=1746091 RepID=A0AAV7ZEG2_9EUKA|nr:ras-related protein rab-5c [Anaeramoeba flamelloides]KAJ6245089.1 ras-related protein rab-5c [Anaeramoeba flamelloides]